MSDCPKNPTQRSRGSIDVRLVVVVEFGPPFRLRLRLHPFGSCPLDDIEEAGR